MLEPTVSQPLIRYNDAAARNILSYYGLQCSSISPRDVHENGPGRLLKGNRAKHPSLCNEATSVILEYMKTKLARKHRVSIYVAYVSVLVTYLSPSEQVFIDSTHSNITEHYGTLTHRGKNYVVADTFNFPRRDP